MQQSHIDLTSKGKESGKAFYLFTLTPKQDAPVVWEWTVVPALRMPRTLFPIRGDRNPVVGRRQPTRLDLVSLHNSLSGRVPGYLRLRRKTNGIDSATQPHGNDT